MLNQTFKDFEWLVELNYTGKPDLNQAYNRMLRRAKGEIFVSLQDNIELSDMALESIVSFHEQYPNVFFTYPVSQGSPDKWDWRMEYEDQEVGALDWEIDFGSAPMKALKQIGGFDETLDDGRWGFDNVNVGLRASLAGYKIRNCPRTCAYGLPHERESFRDMRDVLYHNERLDEFRHGLTLPPLE